MPLPRQKTSGREFFQLAMTDTPSIVTSGLPVNWEKQSALRHALLIFIGAVFLHAAGTWILPITDRDEARFAEASREMRQSGDWVVPTLNNKPRYDKPPLIYWTQIATYSVLGENEFAARLPSVWAAALAAVAVYGFGRRMRNARTGLWAAIFFTTSLWVLVTSKTSVADPLMILFFTTSAWSAWELGRPLTGRLAPDARWHWMFAGSLGLAFLAKGPIGWLPLLFPILASLWMRESIPWRRLQLHWALLAALGIVALWGVSALNRTHGDFWSVGMGKHVFQRSVSAMEGHGGSKWTSYLATLPYYFLAVFVTFFPWSIRLIWLARDLLSRRTTLSYDERFLLSGIAVVFAVFTLVRTKLPHYTLPAFPLLCLLLSCAWNGAGKFNIGSRRLAIGMVGFGLCVSLIGFSLAKPSFPSAELFKGCKPWLKPEMEMASATYNEPSLCWNFRSILKSFVDYREEKSLPAFMSRPGARLCILPTSKVDETFAAIPDSWQRVRVKGFNLANGKRVDLTALIQESAP